MANTFKNAHVADVGTSPATVYTAPGATTTIILGMSICNKTAATVKCDVVMKDAGVNDRYLLKAVEVPAGVTLEVLAGQKYVLETTDAIQVVSDTATSVDVIMGIMEIS